MFIEWILALLLLTFGSSSSMSLDDGPCNFMDTVNITGGFKDSDKNYHFNGIIYKFGTYAEYTHILNSRGKETRVGRHFRGCICKYRPCIRLCCQGTDEPCVKSSSLLRVPMPDGEETIDLINNTEYAFLVDKPCLEMYKLEPADYEEDKWTLLTVS